MGRKMVMVAGLLTNSVTMDTKTHASRVIAHGGRLLRDSIWCPIHVERPELCGRRERSKRMFQGDFWAEGVGNAAWEGYQSSSDLSGLTGAHTEFRLIL